ncbi:MAG: TlpA family protein disulfide reductase [Flavobacteriaceae bacterium]|nr:TlpA family protein disulfide reductase [Flavobacteriaceae bacterium]MBL6679070.1 TlpA family protein disulfide reductase [Flavobacteriaceae bacterium]
MSLIVAEIYGTDLQKSPLRKKRIRRKRRKSLDFYNFNKNKKVRRTTILILFSFLLFACNSNITNNNISDLESLQLKSSFFDLEENNLDLSEFNNGKVVVSYWATWCAPCIKEMPSMKRAEEILEDYGYTFLLVSDETIDKISNFKNEMNFDLNFLKSNKSFESLGVYAMPTSYIFNENGKIVETFVGVIEWDSEEIINKLKML